MIILTHEINDLVKDNNAFIVLVRSIAMRASYGAQSCFPSHSTMCKDTGLSKSTIIRSLKYLSDIGIINITKRKSNNGGDTSNIYSIKTDKIKVIGNLQTSSNPSVTDTPPQCQRDTPPVSEIDTNHKLNLTTSSINHSSLSEIEKKLNEVKSHPLFETIYTKLKNKNMNDEEMDSEIKVAIYKYIEDNKQTNIISYLNSWFSNVKYQWKPQKPKWQKAKEAEDYYQSNSDYNLQDANIVDLFQEINETKEEFEIRAKERTEIFGTKYRLHFIS